MTAMQLQLNSDLFGALQVISGDEGLMKKAVKSLKRLATMKIAKGNLKPIAIEDLWK